MASPSVDNGPVSVLAPPKQPLALCVRGGRRDGQEIRLSSPKITIGSDRRCTLRLCGRGVQPIHCLILRGPVEVVIRRWSPDTFVNGATFNDTTLTPGDRLRCGPVELEVLPDASPQKKLDVETVAQQLAEQKQLIEEQRSELSSKKLSIDEARNRWKADRDCAQQQLDRLASELSAQADRLEQSRALFDRDLEQRQAKQSSDADARRQALRDAQDELVESQRHWQLECQQTEQRIAEQQEQISRQFKELALEREELENQRCKEQPRQQPLPQPEQQSPQEPAVEAEPTIEEYMAGLISRTGVTDSTSVVSQAPPQGPTETRAQPATEARQNERRRTPRPSRDEQQANLANMRALAIESTQTALDHHGKSHWLKVAIGKTTVSLTALCVGMAVWLIPSGSSVALTSSMVLLVVATFWGVQAVLVWRYYLRLRRCGDSAEAVKAIDNDSQVHPTSPPEAR